MRENDRIGERKEKVPGKDKWETLNGIPIMTLVGINHRQPILHLSKIMIHCYSTDENINQSSIGYMINPSLNCNKLFIIQVETYLSLSFAAIIMETIKYCLKNNNTFVMAPIMIYENNG